MWYNDNMKIFGTIYKVTRKSDGMSYIGKTTKSAMERLKNHYHRPNKEKSYFDNALIKGGLDSFILEELYVAFDEESLNNAEFQLVNDYDTLYPNGFNLKHGGFGGSKWTQKAKDNMSKVKKGCTRKGVSPSIEVRNKIRDTLGGKAIVAINVKTGEVKHYNSLFAVEKDGFSTGNVGTILRKTTGRKTEKGFTFEYANQSGSTEINTLVHAQRIGLEPAKAE